MCSIDIALLLVRLTRDVTASLLIHKTDETLLMYRQVTHVMISFMQEHNTNLGECTIILSSHCQTKKNPFAEQNPQI